jgi:uncharacterized RDD family membrane protein YckC
VVAQEADRKAPTTLASWGRRAAAYLLDAAIVGILFGAVAAWVISTSDPDTGEASDAGAVALFVALVVVDPLYNWLMLGRWGQTIGKMVLGIRVVRAKDEGRVGYLRALGRVASVLLLAIFTLPLLLAYLWPLWDDENQTLYDKMARTIVVYER